MAKGTKKKKEPRVIPGTSDYVVRENAARKQLGVAGLAARNKQVPAAARATARGLLREITGIDVSRKGVSVDPMGLAMALPIGKVLKAAKILRAAGNIKKAAALESRIAAKIVGKKVSSSINFYDRTFDNGRLPVNSRVESRMAGAANRRIQSESVFPRKTFDSGSRGLTDEYLVAKSGYEKVFGKGKKLSSFNPDVAAMTSIPGRGATTAKIRKISDQVDSYLAKRGRKGLGR